MSAPANSNPPVTADVNCTKTSIMNNPYFKYGLFVVVISLIVFYIWPKIIKPMMKPSSNIEKRVTFDDTNDESVINKTDSSNVVKTKNNDIKNAE